MREHSTLSIFPQKSLQSRWSRKKIKRYTPKNIVKLSTHTKITFDTDGFRSLGPEGPPLQEVTGHLAVGKKWPTPRNKMADCDGGKNDAKCQDEQVRKESALWKEPMAFEESSLGRWREPIGSEGDSRGETRLGSKPTEL